MDCANPVDNIIDGVRDTLFGKDKIRTMGGIAPSIIEWIKERHGPDEETFVFRGMRADPDFGPQVGRNKSKLGVTVEGGKPDMHPTSDGLVGPGEGLSTDVTPWSLPDFRKPPSFGGRDKKLQVYKINVRDLPAGLRMVPDGGGNTHAMIEPAYEMPLAEYEALLASTRPLWKVVTPGCNQGFCG
ncbi:hypothetical protein [Embleya sp. NPDC059259]|uniref:Tse2 family ADP-ribosyltransferase toxin n=1 Tax=unclassified Embleya TaxID=2699296 RepID=UPI0036A62914